jgi:AbrB family looped-hinge helix DNA binding protein
VKLAMTQEVVVTRKGQTTIPIELRRKYKVEEGSRMQVLDNGDGILFKPKFSFFDMMGADAKVATTKEMKTLLDKLREEDA